MKSLALVLSVLTLTLTSHAFAAKCQVGETGILSSAVSGVSGGSQLVTLDAGSAVVILEVPSAYRPNYEVLPLAADSILLGATTLFNECTYGSCRAGSVVTLAAPTAAVAGGAPVTLSAGTRVLLKSVPSGIYPNYEVVVLDDSATSVLVSGSTSFQTCQ
jgi:hypothetical protein